MNNGRAWFALATTARALGFAQGRRVFPEFAAIERITRDGFESFTPRLRRLRRAHRGARRRETVVTPLFPGYIFAALDARAINTSLAQWPEVHDVVRVAGHPRTVPEAVVDAVRALDMARDKTDRTGRPETDRVTTLKPGDRVEPRGVAYAGLVGQIISLEREHARVLVELLGGERAVKMRLAELERAA